MHPLTAFLIGLAGSAHCLVMCGPLVLALKSGKGFSSVIHHGSRILMYGLLGALAGALGKSMSFLVARQYLSIALGSIMIALVLTGSLFGSLGGIRSLIGSGILRLNGLIHGLTMGKSLKGVMLGAVNALLPCGLIYVGLAGAAGTYTPWGGALFMLLFGLGTLPVLTFVTAFGQVVNATMRSKMRPLLPAVVFVVGLLLILRGSNLGIPYLSPKTQPENKETICE